MKYRRAMSIVVLFIMMMGMLTSISILNSLFYTALFGIGTGMMLAITALIEEPNEKHRMFLKKDGHDRKDDK